MVIICDDTAIKNTWERGVVSKWIPDQYGIIRKADVKVWSGIIGRPVSKSGMWLWIVSHDGLQGEEFWEC